jgi:hypothetical protein
MIKTSGGVSTILSPEPYDTEAELETLLRNNPALLAEPDEPPLSLVARQYRIGGAGIADLLFVDSEGFPVLVEVKLARNPESRRQVIAQVFDYAAALAEQTVDELDLASGGGVESALRRVCATEAEFRGRWQSLARNLRSGDVRVVVAVDMDCEDLSRVVGFTAIKSKLDVRLVVVEKYSDSAGGFVYSATTVVRSDVAEPPVAERRSPVERRPDFQAVLDAWKTFPDAPLPLKRKAGNYATLEPSG